MNYKFSDLYIETIKIVEERIVIEFEKPVKYVRTYDKIKLKKELIPRDKSLYYVWGNIGYTILMDYNCKINNNLIKIKDLCFSIEKSIKRGDLDIVLLDIQNVLLPLLDKLTNDAIITLKKAHRISAGPLYEYTPLFSTPQLFVDLFNFSNNIRIRPLGG